MNLSSAVFLLPVCSEVWSLHSCLDIALAAERRSGYRTGCTLTSDMEREKKHSLSLRSACAGVCALACMRNYRRSVLLRRKSFLVCAISASLGRGGKTCWRQIIESETAAVRAQKTYRWVENIYRVTQRHTGRVESGLMKTVQPLLFCKLLMVGITRK